MAIDFEFRNAIAYCMVSPAIGFSWHTIHVLSRIEYISDPMAMIPDTTYGHE